MAGNVEKGEAPTFLREHLGIRFDENLDGLFAGINLDTNGRVAEIDLVASSVFSSNRWRAALSSRFTGLAANSLMLSRYGPPKTLLLQESGPIFPCTGERHTTRP